MRAALLGALMAVAVAGATQAATDVRRIEVDGAQSLQDQLLAMAQERLHGTGLTIDRERVWMSMSTALAAVDRFEVRPTWSADAPTLPLTFELRPASRAAGAPTIQVTLGVTLLREVWVAERRLRKGSLVSCADLTLQRRRVQDLPRTALAGACEVARDAVSLRDIAAGAVVRSTDVGKAPDVMAGAPVRVSVATGGISVMTSAVALADASVGDQIDVRLQRPARTLRTRVTGPGLVQLVEGSP
jgi:flagellar basal body P-ring formation protein FlgA